MAISSSPGTITTTNTTNTTKFSPHHRRHRNQQQQQQQYEEVQQRRARRKKKKKHAPAPILPSKIPSSWEQFKSILTCRSIDPSQVHKHSSSSATFSSTSTNGKLGLSCSSICSIKDVVHTNTRVVHRGDRDRSPESSGRLGPETSLLAARSSTRSTSRHHPSFSRGMHLTKFAGCYECHAISDPSRYPMPRMICSCPDCGEVFTKPESLELHQMVRHAVSELGPDDSGRNIVEIIFKSSWVKKDILDHLNLNNPTFCKIDRILKVHNAQRTISRFEAYRDAVKSRAAAGILLHNNHSSITTNATGKPGKKNPRCAADGNELLRFHCTTLNCSLGAHGSTSLCCGYSSSNSNFNSSSTPPCGVCSIIRHGFSRAKQETGKGVRTTASSGRAHDGYFPAGEDGGRRRAMLVCRVIAGRVRRAGDDALGMEDGVIGVGYDSVGYGGGKSGGGGGNVEELFVTNPRAILPCFVVVYQTSLD